jgi:hypothetical protein
VAEAIKTGPGRTALRLTDQRRQQLVEKLLVARGEQAGTKLVAKPAIERAAEIAGGSAALGVGFGGEDLLEGAPLSEAARTALITGVLTAGIEGSLATILPKIIASTRSVDRAGVNAWWNQTAKPILVEGKAALKDKDKQLTAKLNAVLGTKTQQMELFRGEALSLTSTKKAAKARRKEAREIIQDIRKNRSSLAALEERIAVGPVGTYRRNRPYNPGPGTWREFFANSRLALITTPQGIQGMLGRTMMKTLEDGDVAINQWIIAKDQNKVLITTSLNKLSEAVGLKGKAARAESPAWYPIVNAWEKWKAPGVVQYMRDIGRGQFADDAVKVFTDIKAANEAAHRPLVKHGAERALTQHDLKRMGVGEFVPQALDDLPEAELIARLQDDMGTFRANQLLEQTKREGLAKFGSIDFQRKMPGTLWEKAQGIAQDSKGRFIQKKPMPLSMNFWDNELRYLNAVHLRLEFAKKFGFDSKIKDLIEDAAVAEGASPALVHNLTDMLLDHKYYPQAWRKTSSILTNYQTGSKMGFGVIANASQPANNLFVVGFRQTMRSAMGARLAENKHTLLGNIALSESVITAPGGGFATRHLAGAEKGRIASFGEKFAYATLNLTGFSAIEKWNRMWSGQVGFVALMDMVGKGLQGKLKGQTLDVARRRAQWMGVNLDDTLKQIREGGDDFMRISQSHETGTTAWEDIVQRAMLKSSQLTQFNPPSPLRTPTAWNHPFGRVATQFKTFALGQGRLVRDLVFAEAAQGNLAPMAYFLGVYPVMGEVVGNIKSVLKGKERDIDGIARYAQDISFVGGVGMFTDTLTSAVWGKGLESILGPTSGDLNTIMTNMARLDAEGTVNQVRNMPTFQAITAFLKTGVLTTAAIVEFSNRLSDEPEQNTTTIDIGTLRTTPKR